MCYSCWKGAGSPELDTEPVRRAAAAIGRLYEAPGCGVGGLLHTATDDYNLGDENIAWCRMEIENPPTWAGELVKPSALKVQLEALEALEVLTETERYAAVGLYWGDWKIEGRPEITRKGRVP